jgi:hypothetical protein
MSLKIKEKIDCCGSNFETKDVSMIGLLTMSAPIAFIMFILIPFLYLLSFIPLFKRIREKLIVINSANNNLVENQNIFQKSRCNVAVIISKFSSALSNKIYKHFNMACLFIFWISISLGVTLSV